MPQKQLSAYLTIEQFIMRIAHNSTFNIQNSKFIISLF